MKTNIKDVTPVYLNSVDPLLIVDYCSSEHIGNVITNHITLLKAAKELVEIVVSLNPKSGELGEGRCLQMQEIANELLEKLK